MAVGNKLKYRRLLVKNVLGEGYLVEWRGLIDTTHCDDYTKSYGLWVALDMAKIIKITFVHQGVKLTLQICLNKKKKPAKNPPLEQIIFSLS